MILLILLILAVAILTYDRISYDNDIKTDSIKTQLDKEWASETNVYCALCHYTCTRIRLKRLKETSAFY